MLLVVVPNARDIVFAVFISGYVKDSGDDPVPLIHVPFIAKHPLLRFIPFEKVEEAVVEVTFSRFV